MVSRCLASNERRPGSIIPIASQSIEIGSVVIVVVMIAKSIAPDDADGRFIRSVVARVLQEELGKSGGVEQHPFSQCLHGVGKTDVVAPRDDAEHATLGLLGKPV
jgi:hypothetical protein